MSRAPPIALAECLPVHIGKTQAHKCYAAELVGGGCTKLQAPGAAYVFDSVSIPSDYGDRSQRCRGYTASID